MTSITAAKMLDKMIAARLPGFIGWLPLFEVELVVSVALVSSVTDWLPDTTRELTTEFVAVSASSAFVPSDSDTTRLPGVVVVACRVMVENPAIEVEVCAASIEPVLVAAPARIRPGVSGCVSRIAKSSSRNLICNAGPTVTVAAARVNPQTPPRKSVVSVVHV